MQKTRRGIMKIFLFYVLHLKQLANGLYSRFASKRGQNNSSQSWATNNCRRTMRKTWLFNVLYSKFSLNCNNNNDLFHMYISLYLQQSSICTRMLCTTGLDSDECHEVYNTASAEGTRCGEGKVYIYVQFIFIIQPLCVFRTLIQRK